MITLNWIGKSPHTWKTFVSNRVLEIQQLVPAPHWRHVPSSSNPADHVSWGLLPADLVSNKLWWHGLSWRCQSPEQWPTPPDFSSSDCLPEAKGIVLVVVSDTSPNPVWSKLSTYVMLQQIVAWFRCFAFNCKNEQKVMSSTLSSKELEGSRLAILLIVQRKSFQDTCGDPAHYYGHAHHTMQEED